MLVYILSFLSLVAGLIFGIVSSLFMFKPRDNDEKFVKADYRNAAPEAEDMPLEKEEKEEYVKVVAHDVPEQQTEPESRLQKEARARRGVSMVDLSSKEDVREHLKAGKAKEERGYNILKSSTK